ncbi:putative protein delta [Cricetulus griseus]|uniref:Protein delta homolog 1 n=1 Tax=Cricetulus griseus TaxID=10029 RepID=A0A061I658_CRIGR|nr:putative protein delta [Cricetulus griseus]
MNNDVGRHCSQDPRQHPDAATEDVDDTEQRAEYYFTVGLDSSFHIYSFAREHLREATYGPVLVKKRAVGAECDPACDPKNGFCEDGNVCRCQPGWEGPQCDQCITSPGCVNGVCEEPWQCICKNGWDGDLCDIEMPACTSTPCANNGTCVDLEKGQYECSCAPGFSGKDCQNKAGPCVINGSPCQHGGACVDDEGRASHASCLCPPGFSGNFCEIIDNSCTPNPCENDGVCTDIGGDFRCRCPAGFVDKTCSRPVSSCASGPCLNGGTCLQHTQLETYGALLGCLTLGLEEANTTYIQGHWVRHGSA